MSIRTNGRCCARHVVRPIGPAAMQRRTVYWVAGGAACFLVLAASGGIAAYLLFFKGPDNAPAAANNALTATHQPGLGPTNPTTGAKTGASTSNSTSGSSQGSTLPSGIQSAAQISGSPSGSLQSKPNTYQSPVPGTALPSAQLSLKPQPLGTNSPTSSLAGSSISSVGPNGHGLLNALSQPHTIFNYSSGPGPDLTSHPSTEQKQPQWWEKYTLVPVGSITSYLQQKGADWGSTIDWGRGKIAQAFTSLSSIKFNSSPTIRGNDHVNAINEPEDTSDNELPEPPPAPATFTIWPSWLKFKSKQAGTTYDENVGTLPDLDDEQPSSTTGKLGATTSEKRPDVEQKPNMTGEKVPRQSTFGWLYSLVASSSPEPVEITHDNVLGMRAAVLNVKKWAGADLPSAESKEITAELSGLNGIALVAAFEATKLFDKRDPSKFAAQVIRVEGITPPLKMYLLACLPAESLAEIPDSVPLPVARESRIHAAAAILENVGMRIPINAKPEKSDFYSRIAGIFVSKRDLESAAKPAVSPTPKQPVQTTLTPPQKASSNVGVDLPQNTKEINVETALPPKKSLSPVPDDLPPSESTGENSGGLFNMLGFGGTPSPQPSTVLKKSTEESAMVHDKESVDNTMARPATEAVDGEAAEMQQYILNVHGWTNVNLLKGDKLRVLAMLAQLEGDDLKAVYRAARAFASVKDARVFLQDIDRTTLSVDQKAHLLACLPANALKALLPKVDCASSRIKAAHKIIKASHIP